MNACDICFSETRNRRSNAQGDLECTECRAAREYYQSLTPSELRAEHESMARHADEEQRRARTEGAFA